VKNSAQKIIPCLYMTEQREKTIIIINDSLCRNFYLTGVPLFASCIGKVKNFQ